MENNDIEKVKLEDDALGQSIALNKIVLNLIDKQKANINSLIIALVIVTLLSFGFSILLMISNNQNNDKMIKEISSTKTEFIELIQNLEFTTETIETTETTQTVEGDGFDIVNGNQYNDESIHEEKR